MCRFFDELTSNSKPDKHGSADNADFNHFSSHRLSIVLKLNSRVGQAGVICKCSATFHGNGGYSQLVYKSKGLCLQTALCVCHFGLKSKGSNPALQVSIYFRHIFQEENWVFQISSLRGFRHVPDFCAAIAQLLIHPNLSCILISYNHISHMKTKRFKP